MNIENLIELIHIEFVLESMGLLLGICILWQLLFQQGLSSLLSLFIISIS